MHDRTTYFFFNICTIQQQADVSEENLRNLIGSNKILTNCALKTREMRVDRIRVTSIQAPVALGPDPVQTNTRSPAV